MCRTIRPLDNVEPPRDRGTEAVRARARAELRYAR